MKLMLCMHKSNYSIHVISLFIINVGRFRSTNYRVSDGLKPTYWITVIILPEGVQRVEEDVKD